jgi:hypothetical protein
MDPPDVYVGEEGGNVGSTTCDCPENRHLGQGILAADYTDYMDNTAYIP